MDDEAYDNDPPAFQTDEDVVQAVLSQLDGSVQSQGVRVGASAWLDLGSKDWVETDDPTRAAAYQAAKITGWTDDAIKDIVRQAYPHILASVLEHTFSVLHRLAESHPVAVESTSTATPESPEAPTKTNQAVAEEQSNA